MIEFTFRIEGMSCPNCSIRLEGLEDTMQGIHRAEASYQKGTLKVEFDEAALSVDEILNAIVKMGYRATIK